MKFDEVLIYCKRRGDAYGFPLGYRGKCRDSAYHWKSVAAARDYAKRRAQIGHWAGERVYEITGKIGNRTFYTIEFIKVPKYTESKPPVKRRTRRPDPIGAGVPANAPDDWNALAHVFSIQGGAAR